MAPTLGLISPTTHGIRASSRRRRPICPAALPAAHLLGAGPESESCHPRATGHRLRVLGASGASTSRASYWRLCPALAFCVLPLSLVSFYTEEGRTWVAVCEAGLGTPKVTAMRRLVPGLTGSVIQAAGTSLRLLVSEHTGTSAPSLALLPELFPARVLIHPHLHAFSSKVHERMSMMLDTEEAEPWRICLIRLKIKSPPIHFVSAPVEFLGPLGAHWPGATHLQTSSSAPQPGLAHQLPRQLPSCC